MRTLNLPTARVFEPLLEPAPYKGAWGGRGSGKSHDRADALVEDCLAEPGNSGGEGMRAVCIREVQKDLKQSSKLLVESKLRLHGITERDGFKVYDSEIRTPGDGIIIFKGMNDYTADSIKSLEGFKRAWWEEAHTATVHSLNLLRPTLRVRGAERHFTWNPRRKADAIEKLLRGPIIPTGAIVVRANWRDNPWWNEELERERVDFLRMSPDQYDHIWEGEYVTAVAGSYFAAELARAKLQGRIGFVPADPLLTRHAFVDIGGAGSKADAFAMWILQFVGLEIRALDYYEAQSQTIATHIDWLRSRNYTPARCKIWLPHDGETVDRVHDVSYESEFRKAQYNVEVVPNQGKGAAKMRIEAVRKQADSCRFNAPEGADWEKAPTCQAGLEALGWYHEKLDDKRQIGLGPEHDWSSHGSDAFGLGCVVAERLKNEATRQPATDPNKGFRRAIG